MGARRESARLTCAGAKASNPNKPHTFQPTSICPVWPRDPIGLVAASEVLPVSTKPLRSTPAMPAITPRVARPRTSPPRHGSLSQRIEQAKQEFALPENVRRVIASPDFDGRREFDGDEFEGKGGDSLVRWLAEAPEICHRLLRWCNTPLYNLARPYRSLAEACHVMDTRELTRLAVLAHIREFFSPDVAIDQYRRESLWSHSIAVAAAASMIARSCEGVDPSLAFLAGGLHDIGLCASERLDPRGFGATVALVDELSPLDEVERELLGWDHTELGEAILNDWGMPATVALIARYHHDADLVLSGPAGPAVACVTLANYLCSRAGWMSAGRLYLSPPSKQVFARLSIDAPLLAVIWKQLDLVLASVTPLR